MRMPDRREILESIATLPFWRLAAAGGTHVNKSQWADRTVMWRRVLDDSSFELVTVARSGGSHHISGTALIAEAGAPSRVDYAIECGANWETRHVEIRQLLAEKVITLTLAADHGKWLQNGIPAPELDGCTDIDLGISPSTNALPINRLGIPVGQSRQIRAAWVQFPRCIVEPAQQSYERLATTRYRYRSLSSGFTALIEVDDAGLPIDYSGVWRRVAASEGMSVPRLFDQKDLRPVGFIDVLVSSGPSAELGKAADTFSWIIGGWAAEVRDFDEDGSVRTGTGEWWFSWVLEGRAVQDVWIVPPQAERMEKRQTADNRYGSTLRYYDKAADLWRIVWVNPVTGALNALQGRRSGDRIVLDGTEAGNAIRWTLDDIKPNNFLFRGEEKTKAGVWRLAAEFRLRRIA